MLRSAIGVRRYGFFMIALALLGLIMLAFLILPILNVVVTSQDGILAAFLDAEVRSAILMSLYTATIATILTLAFGVPFSYILTRSNFWGKTLIDSVIDLPILIPHTAAGVALLALFGPRALIGTPLSALGIDFVGTLAGVVIAQMFVSAPFMIRTAQEAFESISPSLEKVAQSLGASRLRTFFYVTLPLASRGILAGCILTWARAVSEFGAVIILSYHPMTAPVLIYERFIGWGLGNAGPIAALLILITATIFLAVRLFQTRPLRKVYGR